MPTAIATEAINFDELKQAFDAAPGLVQRNVKSELFRFARRVRRKTIRERLSGPPGIDGGQFKRGKHVQAFTTGSDLASLKAVNKISRILRVHEEGGTITAKGGGYLYLSRKTRTKGGGKVFARVKQVVIKPRLGFTKVWERETPDAIRKIGNGVDRAMHEAMDRQLKAITSTITRLAG